MKRLITIIKKEVADELEAMGYKYMVQHLDNDKEVYSFIESDELFRLLNDKKKYSKKEWFIDNRLRF